MPILDIRKRIFIITGILVGLIVVFVIFFLLIRDDAPPAEEVTEPTSTPGQNIGGTATPTPGGVDTQTPSTPTMPPEDNYVRQLARLFVERYGSYSNQNDNSHIADVLPLATDSMAAWLRAQTIPQNGDYEGVTTQVIVSTIESLTDTQASVRVEVQELLETRTSRETNYRTGTVTLLFQNGEWKVDGLFWDSE